MNIAIIGASAGVGFEALQQALNLGHNVQTLSRTIDSLPTNQCLIPIKGSATNRKDVISVLHNTDAVLITVGTKDKKGTKLFSEMAKTVVEAAQEVNYQNPILIVSGFGVGSTYKYLSVFMKFIIRFFLKDQNNDKELMEKIFCESNLQWEIVQPGILTNTEMKGKYTILSSLFRGMKVGKISRADVAHYLLAESESMKYIQKKVVITD